MDPSLWLIGRILRTNAPIADQGQGSAGRREESHDPMPHGVLAVLRPYLAASDPADVDVHWRSDPQGMTDGAISKLEEAVEQGYKDAVILSDPDLDTLRSDDRFDQLVAGLGFQGH